MIRNLIPKTLTGKGSAIAHTVLGGGLVYLLIAGRIPLAVGVGILSAMGGAWSGVGAALKVSGSSTAATVPEGAPGAPSAAPAPELVTTHADGSTVRPTIPAI